MHDQREAHRPMKKKAPRLLAGLLAATALAAADAAGPASRRPDVARIAHACSGCHGTYGHSLPPTPAIAGMPEEDFIAAMRDFKSGKRVSSAMNRIAQGFTEEDFRALAHFFKNR